MQELLEARIIEAKMNLCATTLNDADDLIRFLNDRLETLIESNDDGGAVVDFLNDLIFLINF